MREAISSGELVAPFKRSADPARAYFAIVSKNAADRKEMADFIAWLKEEAASDERTPGISSARREGTARASA